MIRLCMCVCMCCVLYDGSCINTVQNISTAADDTGWRGDESAQATRMEKNRNLYEATERELKDILLKYSANDG